MLMNPTDAQVRDAIVGLLLTRSPLATICPSEAARALAPASWRPLMPQVRAVAVALAKEGLLEIRSRGLPVSPHEPLRGPIRLARATITQPGKKPHMALGIDTDTPEGEPAQAG